MNPPTSTNEQVFCCEMINHDADEKYNTTNKNMNLQHRSTREFVPEEKKDDMYWFKRVKNNASARKSRMKKQAMHNGLCKKMMLLWSENLQLRSVLANTLNTIHHRRPSQNRNISSMTPIMKEEEPYESVRNLKKYTTSFISSERRIEDASNMSSLKREMRRHQADNSLSFMEDGFYPSESSSDCSGDHSSTYTIDDDVDKKNGTITPNDGSLWSDIVPHTMTNQTDDTSKAVAMEIVTHIPHKIRIKQRVHSAFAKDNSY